MRILAANKMLSLNTKTTYTILCMAINIIAVMDCRAQVNDDSDKANRSRKAIIHLVDGRAEFQEMIELEDRSAIDLDVLVNQWAILAFYSSSSVMRAKSKNELLRIEGLEPGIMLYKSLKITASLKYMFSIENEDNKLFLTMSHMELIADADNKYLIEKFIYEKNGKELITKQATRVKDHATKVANVLISSFKTFLAENNIAIKW